jgi:oligopeptide transport system ATP-binding protein
MVEVSPGHFVFGNSKEIEEYKAIRARGEKIKSITIADAASAPEQPAGEEEPMSSGDFILDAPLHDTGSLWYSIASFFLPILGLIAALLFKKFNYIRNFKACRKGALIGLCVIAALILLLGLALLRAVI